MVIIGIVNHEYETVSYRVEVKINEDRWENEVSFALTVAGTKQKIEFLLYKKGETTPLFEPLRLWLDVRGE